MMETEIYKVETRDDLKKFIFYPASLHRNHKNWVPPIYSDEWTFLSTKKNKNMRSNDTLLLLAYDGDKIVGRIMGIINRHHNEVHNLKTARFFYLECENNPEIWHALIQSIENWAKEKGMNKMIGHEEKSTNQLYFTLVGYEGLSWQETKEK